MIRQNEHTPRARLATDTSSLILLQKTDLLPVTTSGYQLIITPLILAELRVKENIFEWKKYVTVQTGSFTDDINLPKSFSAADKSLVLLRARLNGAAVLSEDGRVLRYCREQGWPHYCALSLMAILHQQSILTMDEAQTAQKKLKALGRYANWVCEIARQMLDEK